jgi:hypothetical protein
VALRHVFLWLDHLSQHGNKPTQEVLQAVEDFSAAAPKAKQVRDMLEHEDEYIVGGGRDPAGYQVDMGGLLASAHSVGVHGKEYIIGGRVSLPGSTAALRKLTPVLAVASGLPQEVTFHLTVGRAG